MFSSFISGRLLSTSLHRKCCRIHSPGCGNIIITEKKKLFSCTWFKKKSISAICTICSWILFVKNLTLQDDGLVGCMTWQHLLSWLIISLASSLTDKTEPKPRGLDRDSSKSESKDVARWYCGGHLTPRSRTTQKTWNGFRISGDRMESGLEFKATKSFG